MKKNNFMKGSFITTLGIVITKMIGLLYVIPFHSIIGDKGGALYGYAYTIYSLFISLATAGIPLAISKVVSEYQTLGYYSVKRRAFILGKKVSLLLGFISFILIMLFAPILASLVIKDVSGGNSVDDIAFVIRVIGTAILIVPTLSIYRGYFEGHRFMSPPSISQIIEQLVRVLVIILGSFLSYKVFHYSIKTTVGIAVFGATLGSLASYIYLVDKYLKNKKRFQERIRQVNEPIISNKEILLKILYYAFPFIMIDFFKSLYNTVDMITVVRGLVNYCNYSAIDAEVVYSILSTWGQKINMILLAVSTGIVVSLIPNLTESIVNKDQKEVINRINKALSILLFFTVPMVFGLSFLADPIWNSFYGGSKYGASVISYYVFVAFFMGLYTCLVTVLQTMKDYRGVFISLISGVLVKMLFNSYFIMIFYKSTFPPYYGVITASILGNLLSFVICLYILHNKYHIRFEESLRNFIDIMCASLLMIIVLFVLKLLIKVRVASRLGSVLIIVLYTIVGALVYFIYSYKSKIIDRVLGNGILKYLKIKK